MSKKRVCIVVDNDVYRDSRVRKFSRTLSKKYYVIVVGVSKNRILTAKVTDNFILAGSISLFLYEKIKSAYKKMRPSSGLVTIIRQNTKRKRNAKFFVRDWIWYISGHFVRRKIFSVISKLDVDVYHANDLPTLAPTMKASKKNGAKVIYDSHELYMEQGMFSSDFLINRYKKEEASNIRLANAVVTVNEFIGSEMKKRYGTRENPEVVYNYPYATKALAVQQKHKEIILLYQGLYGPSRGLEELIESIRFVGDKYTLKLRGVGDYIFKLKQIVKEQKLEDRVEFLEPVKSEDLTRSAEFADVGVIMYKAECLNNLYASPNKLFEYINAGLAILCNDLPFVASIVKTHNLGICVREITTKALVEAINRFDQERITLFKSNAFQVSNVFTWENQEPKIFETYDKVLRVQ
jgi:glycosyltransferase involved in cell wall biosynthesis